MRDSDVLDNNPRISRSALEAIHDQVFGWALSRCDYNRGVAEDIVQQAYVELLTGRARFDGHSTLKTFVFWCCTEPVQKSLSASCDAAATGASGRPGSGVSSA